MLPNHRPEKDLRPVLAALATRGFSALALGSQSGRRCPMPTFFAVFLAIFVFQPSTYAADKIRIGFAPGASSVPFPLAQKKGFLKEEGLEAEIVRMSSTVQVAALTAGEADYVTGMS